LVQKIFPQQTSDTTLPLYPVEEKVESLPLIENEVNRDALSDIGVDYSNKDEFVEYYKELAIELHSAFRVAVIFHCVWRRTAA